MTLIVLGALAVAWVLVLAPSRKPKPAKIPLNRQPGAKRLDGRSGLAIQQPSFRPSISGALKNTGKRLKPSASKLGFPAMKTGLNPGLRSGLNSGSPARVPVATGTPVTAHGVRRTVPISTADAALRRRDITVILTAAALITLIALFLTQKVWLGVINLGFVTALFGYLWLVSRRLHLHSGNRPIKRSG